MGAPGLIPSAASASRLRLVPQPQQRNLGDLLQELARRGPGGAAAILSIRNLVLWWLSVLPPEL